MKIEKKVCYKVDGHLFDSEAGADNYIRIRTIEGWLRDRLHGIQGNVDNFQDDRITLRMAATTISDELTEFIDLLTDVRALHGVSDD